MTPEDEIQIGADAQTVLESQAFALAFDTLKQELTSQWMQSPVAARDDREKLFLMLKLTDKVRINLESLLTNGRMALEKRRTLMERAKAATQAWSDEA